MKAVLGLKEDEFILDDSDAVEVLESLQTEEEEEEFESKRNRMEVNC